MPLLGAGTKVNKQHARLLLVPAGLRVMRLPAANPVAVNARALAAGEEVELALPITISLSHDDLVIDVQPCKRYYVNAQYESPASPDWKPVIDYVWDIAGCKA